MEVCPCFVPGLFEGVPGANRACAGHHSAARPAVPTGGWGQSRKQGEGAARPVQHPHRRTGCQLMNPRRRLTRVWLTAVDQWTNRSKKGGRELAVSASSGHVSGDVTIYGLLENKKFLVFLLFVLPHSYPDGCTFSFCNRHKLFKDGKCLKTW